MKEELSVYVSYHSDEEVAATVTLRFNDFYEQNQFNKMVHRYNSNHKVMVDLIHDKKLFEKINDHKRKDLTETKIQNIRDRNSNLKKLIEKAIDNKMVDCEYEGDGYWITDPATYEIDNIVNQWLTAYKNGSSILITNNEVSVDINDKERESVTKDKLGIYENNHKESREVVLEIRKMINSLEEKLREIKF